MAMMLRVPPPAVLTSPGLPGVPFTVLDCVASVRLAAPGGISKRLLADRKRWEGALASHVRLGTLALGQGGVQIAAPVAHSGLTFCDALSHPSRQLVLGGRLCATVYSSGRVLVVGKRRAPEDVGAAARLAADIA